MPFLYFGDQQVLRPFLLRRLKKEVESQLPEKVRKPLLQYMSFNLDQSLSQEELRDQIYVKLMSLDVIEPSKETVLLAQLIEVYSKCNVSFFSSRVVISLLIIFNFSIACL